MKFAIGCVSFISVLSGPTAFGQLAEAQDARQRVEAEVYEQLADSNDARVKIIVVLQSDVSFGPAERELRQTLVAQVQQRVLARLTPGDFNIIYQYENIAALFGSATESGIRKLEDDPDVRSVGIDRSGSVRLDRSVPFINADDAHDLGFTGKGITVAVLDSGIDTDHDDLSDNIAEGAWHFLDQGGNQGAGAEDDNGHGTNVSGIITSAGNVAPRGVAPDADILAVKVIAGNGSGWLSDWTRGVDYVVSKSGDYDYLCGINISLGSFTRYAQCPCDDTNSFNLALEEALEAAWDDDLVTFASSGVSGECDAMTSPACLTSAVAVAAVYDQDLGREPNSGTYQSIFGGQFADCFDETTRGDLIACFSARSPCIVLAAPGRLITAPGRGGGLSTFTGTSMSAAHCSGVAALMCQAAKEGGFELKPDQVVAILVATGVKTEDPCNGDPNPIRIDALAAVLAVGGGCDPCDANCDGSVDLTDVEPFIELMLGNGSPCDTCTGDINSDGSVDLSDIEGFIACLLG